MHGTKKVEKITNAAPEPPTARRNSGRALSAAHPEAATPTTPAHAPAAPASRSIVARASLRLQTCSSLVAACACSSHALAASGLSAASARTSDGPPRDASDDISGFCHRIMRR
eukprot:CAMPEP_0182823564 /NCGR_PEP_ID=MMETSP0006_2-20121128/14821_1 /TAXON_ID=97485 /ORGANISM="Prymnesium parvum, Strain Texoma1" /LENGTH=112 /DNA_ID=CAMNT_0024950497 /DNA_START=300 /DNA_END=634 /DNA_ORIENTATION=-